MTRYENWQPPADVLAEFPEISGNEVNGLGESKPRQASCFFWHPPEEQTHGNLQAKVIEYLYRPAADDDKTPPYPSHDPGRGPDAIPLSPTRVEASAAEWTQRLKAFALENEADVVGIARMSDAYLFDGYEAPGKFVVIVGVAHDYDVMSTAPASPEDTRSAAEVSRQYSRAARSIHQLRNFILGQGQPATAYPGPRADAINMVPAAIDCGLGELGKHGSLINRTLGSSFRLAALVTDMPLLPDAPDLIGVDDFCAKCHVCENACPPKAFHSEKQTVRGVEKWYVDFDKCIPFFAEAYGCGACIVACPWSRPGVAGTMAMKLERRAARVKK